MVKMVAHDGRGAVEERGDLVVGQAVEDFGQEVGVVAAAGLDEELLWRGALLKTLASVVSFPRFQVAGRRVQARELTSCSSSPMIARGEPDCAFYEVIACGIAVCDPSAPRWAVLCSV